MKTRISDTEIDFDQMTVLRNGQTQRLTRQSLGILRALFEAGGDVVSKDDLILRAWGDRIVTDATLSTAIKEARRVVGDNGSRQQVIKTVHGVGFRLAVAIEPTGEKPDTELATPCLALLPFRNTSQDPDAQFLCEGITDETISSLSRFSEIKVLSRTTSDAIQGDRLDHDQIRRRYGADFVVEGSVRRTETRLRVSVQLVSTTTGTVVVTEQFDSEATVGDLFDVLDRIAQICAGRLAGPHSPVANETVKRMRTQVPHESWTIFRLVSDFRRFYHSYDIGLHARLRDAFPQALERHPNAADGWAAYSVILLEEFRYHVNERPDVDALALATDAAEKAAQADPRNAFALVALAMCRLFAMDVDGFDLAAQKALELNSGHSDVLSEIGHCYAFLGREEDALRLLDKAMDISPEHPGWYHFARVWRYARLGMFEAALFEMQKVPMPGFYWYHAHLVWLYAALGDLDSAAEQVDLLKQVFPEFEGRAFQELAIWEANKDLVSSALAHWRMAGLVIADETGRPIA
ncbi:winged helix-turn-helix domain-containing tetratricopeptide repeat protein [Ruegeria meonggei]|uniref:winged helix-turn-helix domain-containing tetratricopeptide repeat protein n=1 Tax=Ruegeria meonggei TaxID=1446476 RepID=UPI00366FF03E